MDDDIVEAIRTALEEHRDADHTGIPPAESLRMVAEHRGMVANIDLIVCEISGTPNPLTGDRGPGLASRMKDLEHRANGGGGLSVKRSDKVWIAVASAAGSIAGMIAIIAVSLLR